VRRTVQLASAAIGLIAAVGAVPAVAHSQHAAAKVFAGSAGPALGIGHVFVIVLENKSFEELYGSGGSSYLATSLEPQGTLLTQYYGIGHESNPNYLAMISGQGPNPQTQADCQNFDDFLPSPAVFDPRGNGQAVGTGCIYPSNVLTLPDQLDAANLTWRGYMEDMGNQSGREPAHCGEPASASTSQGPRDATQSATATDQYAARHNPFVYFHSLLDSGDCHADVLPLGSVDAATPDAVLSADLASVTTTANLSFITPDLCHDGHDATCADGGPGGIAGIDDFLATWVPKIESSPAFQQDGLLVITTDESEWGQSQQDSSSCCGEQPGPDTPMPGISGVGGGRTGALVIGRCVPGGAVDDAIAYNHYSLLRTFEDVFGVTSGGADGHGHLGYAAGAGVTSFGPDVFASCPTPVAAHAKKG
jgi:phosphatidylinositol-3-phosphatase